MSRSVMLSLYLLLVAIVQSIMFLIPSTAVAMSEQGSFALLFLGVVITSLAASFLLIRSPTWHVFLSIPVVLICQGIILIFMNTDANRLIFDWKFSQREEFLNRYGYQGTLLSFFLQVFGSLVVAVGLLLRKSFNRFYVRYAGDDPDEIHALYSMKEKLQPSPGITSYRHELLTKVSTGYVGEVRARLVSSIFVVRIDNLAFLYDLMVLPEWRGLGVEQRMVREFLSRPESYDGSIREYIALLPNPLSDVDSIRAAYESQGFEPVDPEDIDTQVEYRKVFKNIFKDKFDGWAPFGEVKGIMVYRGERHIGKSQYVKDRAL